MKNSTWPFIFVLLFILSTVVFIFSCDCRDSDENEEDVQEEEASGTDYVLDLDLTCIDRFCEDLDVFECSLIGGDILAKDFICYISLELKPMRMSCANPNGYSACLCDCSYHLSEVTDESTSVTKKAAAENDYYLSYSRACRILGNCSSKCISWYCTYPSG